MDGFLLKNSKGVLGFIVLDDFRDIRKAIYFVDENRLGLVFADGTSEKLTTPINPEFASQLRSTGDLFIAHFTREDLAADPVKEYHTPLSSRVGTSLAARNIVLTDSRPVERLTVRD